MQLRYFSNISIVTKNVDSADYREGSLNISGAGDHAVTISMHHLENYVCYTTLGTVLREV
jgi:hypothetical protein